VEAASRARNAHHQRALQGKSRSGSKTVKRNRSKSACMREKKKIRDRDESQQPGEPLSDDPE
jgi:hypothetical protein